MAHPSARGISVARISIPLPPLPRGSKCGQNTRLANGLSLHLWLPARYPRRRHGRVEAFDNMAVTPWFLVTADLQVVSPLVASAPAAVMAGLRAQLKF